MMNIDFKSIWSLMKMAAIFIGICLILPLYLILRDL